MKIKDISVTALFCAISVIFSLLNIMLPFSPIVFSLSVVGVFLCGALLKPKLAVLSQVLYILLGLIGLPVFSGFRGGFGALIGPTGGYILSYPIMAFIISVIDNKIKSHTYLRLFVSMIISLIICYIMGSAWLSFTTNISLGKAVMVGVVPFVFFDVIKALLCSALALSLKKILVRTNLL